MTAARIIDFFIWIGVDRRIRGDDCVTKNRIFIITVGSIVSTISYY